MSDKYESVMARASYGYGMQIGEQIERSAFDDLELEAMLDGIRDKMKGNDPAVEESAIVEAFQELHEKIEAQQSTQHEAVIKAGEAFLGENQARPEVNVTETGLQYEVLSEGEGESPTAESTVRVHYEGTLLDGSIFDSSVKRGEPAEFPVGGVIKGWTEALQRMKVGDKWKLYVPQELAYGSQGAGGAIAPFATLIFEVELLDIIA